MCSQNSTWLSAKPFAHRGLHDSHAPENSLAAFENAIRLGMPFELDVQMSQDGTIVVFHDHDLLRLTGVPGIVAETSLGRLKSLRLMGGAHEIPTLREVFSHCGGRVPILIEIKNDGRVGALEGALLEEIRRYDGALAVFSFNPTSVGYFRKHAPDVLRGQIGGGIRDLAKWGGLKKRILQDVHLCIFMLRNALFNARIRPHFMAYGIDALSRCGLRILRSRTRSIPLLLWTVRDPSSLALAREFDCNVIFEGMDPAPSPNISPPREEQ